MRSNKKLYGVLACILLACVLAGAVLLYGKLTFPKGTQNYSTVFEESAFPTDLYRYSQALNWKLRQTEQDNFTLTPAEVLLPGFTASDLLDYAPADEDLFSEEDWSTQASYAEMQADEVIASANNTIAGWYSQFEERWQGLDYLVLDTRTGDYIGTYSDELAALARGNAGAEATKALQDKYRYYAVLRFGDDGQLGIPSVYGAGQDTFDTLQYYDFYQDLKDSGNVSHNLWDAARANYRPASNLAVVFTVPNDTAVLSERFYTDLYYTDWQAVRGTGLSVVYFFAMVLAAAGAIWLLRTERWPLGDMWFAKLPPELVAIGAFVAFLNYDAAVEGFLIQLYRGDYTSGMVGGSIFQFFSGIAGVLLVLGIIALVLCGVESLAMSAWQIKALGFKGYVVGKSWLVWFYHRFRGQITDFYNWIIHIDLTEKGNRTIIKILAVNFVVLTLLCSIWFYGIFGLILYTIVLYFVLRRYFERLKKQYAALLDATGKMAEGNLNVDIPGDLGVFEPLKAELVKVQDGFSRAVAAETKSQNMKTELITNVSHDLKTPLTAIITYVNLLKNEDISEEDRQSYVKTLDLKSQRLKRLIEDLFEMSKAASKDITLNLTQVDLPALIRQVELEAKDELDGAGIEFRYNYPLGQKIEMRLDGEKTSRVFENLILNVAKYGMPGTRAYVTVVAGEKLVTIETKNVSRDELNFDNEEITERFVRGDLSRSTEGSGLGLAIARSFVEAQGGQFKIVTDGDMFKAYITFPREGAPVQRPEPPPFAAAFAQSPEAPPPAPAKGSPGLDGMVDSVAGMADNVANMANSAMNNLMGMFGFNQEAPQAPPAPDMGGDPKASPAWPDYRAEKRRAAEERRQAMRKVKQAAKAAKQARKEEKLVRRAEKRARKEEKLAAKRQRAAGGPPHSAPEAPAYPPPPPPPPAYLPPQTHASPEDDPAYGQPPAPGAPPE